LRMKKAIPLERKEAEAKGGGSLRKKCLAMGNHVIVVCPQKKGAERKLFQKRKGSFYEKEGKSKFLSGPGRHYLVQKGRRGAARISDEEDQTREWIKGGNGWGGAAAGKKMPRTRKAKKRSSSALTLRKPTNP